MQQDVIIIGGGIVGPASPAARSRKSVTGLRIIEKEKHRACHQTGNNSGVIHSGIYYKPGSLKATNCIRGYNMLIDFCRENEVPFDRKCGKIIVATDETKSCPSKKSVYPWPAEWFTKPEVAECRWAERGMNLTLPGLPGLPPQNRNYRLHGSFEVCWTCKGTGVKLSPVSR